MSLLSETLYELNPRIDDVALGDTICFDLETTGDTAWRDDIRVIAIRSEGRTWLLEPEQYTDAELRLLFNCMSERLVIAHNAKFDLNFVFCSYGVLLKNVYCTMVASQVVQGGSRVFRHGLKDCLKSYLGVEMEVDKAELQMSFGNKSVPLTREQLDYAAGDVEFLEPLMTLLNQRASDTGLTKVINLEMKLLPVLVKIESLGCLIDVDAWKRTLEDWRTKHAEIRAKLDEEYVKVASVLFANINYASSKQIIELFKQIDGKVPQRDEGGHAKVSVDEDALNNYLNENPDTKLKRFTELLIDFREFEKLLSTYGESFLDRIDKRGFIHTTYTQTTTATGRLSSKNPNLQNIPSGKSGAGGIVRSFFVAPYGHKLITCDMTGAEVALAADFSGEPLLMRSLTEGLDMHSELASISFSIIFGQPVKISKSTEPMTINGITIIPGEARDIHKSVTFSKFYKGGPKRVYQVLSRYINMVRLPNERMDTAKKISEAIDDALPRLSRYLSRLIDTANANGYLITTKLGRRRVFDTRVYGEASNAPIQGSNADAMKIAMINIDKYLTDTGAGRIILTVHDEVVCEVKSGMAEKVGKIIEDEMSKALSWHLSNLKGKASVHIGDYWEK